MHVTMDVMCAHECMHVSSPLLKHALQERSVVHQLISLGYVLLHACHCVFCHVVLCLSCVAPRCIDVPRVDHLHVPCVLVLVSMGTGFDCASGEEMAACLKLGVAPKDIIFANPIKNVKDLKYAAKVGHHMSCQVMFHACHLSSTPHH